MEVESIPVDRLIPYARNPRVNDSAVDAVAASIKEFGFRQPIVVDENLVILVGHTRLKAAHKLGLDTVPVHVAMGLSETQKKAYRIADNRLNEIAGWDDDLLALEIEDLRLDDFDLGILGFDSGEVDSLLASLDATPEGESDPDDEAPILHGEPITQLGDVWLLGHNRLMCGDSGDAESVSVLMAGDRAILMQTDPPYGVSHVATKDGIPRHGFSDMAQRWEHIKNDDLQDAQLQAFLESVFRTASELALADNAAWYLWHAHLTQGFFAAAAAAADVLLHRQIIWVKPSMVLTRSGMYHWQHEPCFFGWRKGRQPPWYGNKSQTSVWEIGRDRDTIHPTQKPVALWMPGIENHTKAGDVCYEPFSGSGSQIIACEQTGRACYAMELSPQYVDASVRRWQAYTGKLATLESTGQPFPADQQAQHA